MTQTSGHDLAANSQKSSFPIQHHSPAFATAGQIQPSDLAEVAALGFRTVINNRPDGEEGAEQPSSAAFVEKARALKLDYHFLPVVSGAFTEDDVVAMAAILKTTQSPVLAFCRSGARSTMLWRLALNA